MTLLQLLRMQRLRVDVSGEPTRGPDQGRASLRQCVWSWRCPSESPVFQVSLSAQFGLARIFYTLNPFKSDILFRP